MEHAGYSGEPHAVESPSPHAVAGAAASNAANASDAFHMSVELATVGICHLDLAGRFLYVNLALCQLLGYSREELFGFTFQDVTQLSDDTERLASFRRLLSGELLAYRLESQYCRQNGSVVWARANFTLQSATSGAPPYIIALIEDMSERKRLEDLLLAANQQQLVAIRESQQKAYDLAATFDAITDLIVVFDAAGHVRRVNQATRDFMGHHPTLDAGRRHLGLADAQGRPLPPEEWVSSRVLRGETLTGAQAVDMLAAEAGAGHEVLFNVSGAPVRDSQGEIAGGVVVLRDVTERRRLERRTQEALHALLQMAETLVALTPDTTSPVTQADASRPGGAPALNPVAQRLAELAGRVLGCRRVGIVALETGTDVMRSVGLTGLPPEQAAVWCAGLDGRSMTAFIGADRMQKLWAGETVELDLDQQPLRSVARGGPVALAAPLRVGDQLVGALALGYEQEPHAYTGDQLALAAAVGQLAALVIERERLLQERQEARANTLALQEANRRMEEFLSIAGHELRTPLTSVLGALNVLERRLTRIPLADRTREELADQLRMVTTLLGPLTRQGMRLSRLVNDLVDTSRIQTGQLEVHLHSCDLAVIVREVVEEQRLTHPQRTIDLHVALPEDAEAPVVADADRLSQVVTNYLTNALKYSQEDRPVEVRLRVDGHTAQVSVRDEGPGLPQEEQSRVWELFHRAPGIVVQSGSGIGLGMGLHICKTIVERHEGHVGVESAVGRGATFWFTLPLAADTKASAASYS